MWKYLSWLTVLGKQSRALEMGCIRFSSVPSDCRAGQGQLLENWFKAFRVHQTLGTP